MAEMQFNEHRFAMRFREWAKRLILEEIAKLLPADRYGTVASVDYTAMRARVLSSDFTGVTYPFAATVQPAVGHKVRVSGRSSNRYISAITSGPVWVDAVVDGDWVAGVPAAQYMRDSDGLVRLRGLIGDGTANTSALTLPASHTPDAVRSYAVPMGATTFARVDVDTDGTVTPRATSSAIALDGIAFDAN